MLKNKHTINMECYVIFSVQNTHKFTPVSAFSPHENSIYILCSIPSLKNDKWISLQTHHTENIGKRTLHLF